MALTIPKCLLFVDLIWLVLWFIIVMWLEGAYPALDAYRFQVRLIYRHIVCSLALLYVINQRGKYLPLLGIMPFIYALLDDILNAVNVTKRISAVEDVIAYNFTAALTWMALAVSILATCWFIVNYAQSKSSMERSDVEDLDPTDPSQRSSIQIRHQWRHW